MPLFDYMCMDCYYHEERLVKYASRDSKFKCPSCEGVLQRVWLKPPAYNSLGKEGSDKSIKAMQQSFKERFVKKEIDDVRHKFGKTFDDSLVSSAAKRIREGRMNE